MVCRIVLLFKANNLEEVEDTSTLGKIFSISGGITIEM